MCQQHPSTAIPRQAQLVQRLSTKHVQLTRIDVHCVPFCVVLLQQIQVCIPFVAEDLATGEATHWYDHLSSPSGGEDVLSKYRI